MFRRIATVAVLLAAFQPPPVWQQARSFRRMAGMPAGSRLKRLAGAGRHLEKKTDQERSTADASISSCERQLKVFVYDERETKPGKVRR